MADRVNKHHIYSATSWVCAHIWLAAASVSNRYFRMLISAIFVVGAVMSGIKSRQQEGNQ